MRVYLHIATEYDFMDRGVQVAVECGAAPRIGDTFWPKDEDVRALEKAVIDDGINTVRLYSSWIFGLPGKYYLSFDDCIFVSDALWKSDESGEYEYHICLNDNGVGERTSNPPQRYMEKTFTDDDYIQIIRDYENI